MDIKMYPNEAGILKLTKQEYESRINSLLDRIHTELNLLCEKKSLISCFSNLRYAMRNNHPDEISFWLSEFNEKMSNLLSCSVENNDFKEWERIGRDIATDNFKQVDKIQIQGSKTTSYLITLDRYIREELWIPTATELSKFSIKTGGTLRSKDINQIQDSVGKLTQS